MDKLEKETLKSFLPDYVNRITQKSKGGNYNCPICPSGTGQHKTGAFSLYENGTKWKCFSCGRSGDIFDLIGHVENITDPAAQFKRAADLYNGLEPATKQPESREKAGEEEPPEDFTAFFNEAHKNIDKTDYHRGLSKETLDRFNIGYIEKWKHPKTPYPNIEPTPRLIIPTGKHSYLARDTRPAQKIRTKQKVGEVDFLNIDCIKTASTPIYLVEGEIDALSLIDIGVEAIALGGTSDIDKFLQRLSCPPKHSFIIALDNDEPGETAAKKLKTGLDRIGYRNIIANIYGEYNDANEIFTKDKELLGRNIVTADLDADNLIQAEKAEMRRETTGNKIQAFKDAIEAAKNKKVIKTGFETLDSLLEGGLYSGLYVIGAISSLGKTTFCLQIADQIARQGQEVLFFSLEMDTFELMAKSISRTMFSISSAGKEKEQTLTTRQILAGQVFKEGQYLSYTAEEKESLERAIQYYAATTGKHITIKEGLFKTGLDEIRAEVARYTAAGIRPVVVIDYLQIIAPADPKATDKQNMDDKVKGLKQLSRDFDIPVICISSLNRENYTEEISMSAFKESGGIEYSSDVLIGLQYEGMDWIEGDTKENRKKRIRTLLREQKARGKQGKIQDVQLKLLKNRNGGQGDYCLGFMPTHNYFAEYQKAHTTDTQTYTQDSFDVYTGK